MRAAPKGFVKLSLPVVLCVMIFETVLRERLNRQSKLAVNEADDFSLASRDRRRLKAQARTSLLFLRAVFASARNKVHSSVARFFFFFF